ncbi:MAG: Cu2+-containing amine oxidase, partial [Elusimicrobia bacterium]
GGGDGLPRYVADDEPLAGGDLVLWYTLGVTHTPRPEDWPIMSTHRASVRLIPSGFFTKNPALTLPR